jgi:nucleoid DNA-binding protein
MSKTKNDIAKIISSEINVTNKNALNLLNTFLNIVKDKSSNQTVKIGGFGTFKNKTTKSRVGRNPKTKESYTINSFKKIIFKPHNRLKNTLN